MSGTSGWAGIVALLAVPLGGCGGESETSVLTVYAAKSRRNTGSRSGSTPGTVSGAGRT